MTEMEPIKPNQDFKDEKKTYKKGRKYQVPREKAEYFAACGWVGEQPVSSAVHTLDIHDSTLGHEAEFSN